MAEELFTIEEAAARLRRPVQTLYYWRKMGTGPKSFRMGRRIFYAAGDLDAWIQACRDGAAPVS